LGFKSTRCLGHLRCVNNSSEHFLHSVVWNGVSWTGDFAQIPLVGQICTMTSCLYSCVQVLCFCVNTCPSWMYYVIHKL
jgi:hypothetical protein